ncbi:MAG: hypothetical protein JNL11_03020 [Bdellovibrionaceae bacterium]|nr:hypothetical protein [Pseudobdellovibrionaceae bacterium]
MKSYIFTLIFIMGLHFCIAETITVTPSVLLGNGITYTKGPFEANLELLKAAQARTQHAGSLLKQFNNKIQVTGSDLISMFWSWNYLKGQLQVDADRMRVLYGNRLSPADSDFLLEVAKGTIQGFKSYPDIATLRYNVSNYDFITRLYNIVLDVMKLETGK